MQQRSEIKSVTEMKHPRWLCDLLLGFSSSGLSLTIDAVSVNTVPIRRMHQYAYLQNVRHTLQGT